MESGRIMEVTKRGQFIKKKTNVWLRGPRRSQNPRNLHGTRVPPLNLIFRSQHVESLRTRVARKIQAWIAGPRGRFLTIVTDCCLFLFEDVSFFGAAIQRSKFGSHSIEL